MVRKIVKYLSMRTLRAIASVVLLSILLFFAVTRTQFGRDSLSRQIEKSFSSAFAGSLKIEKLTGNLLNTLYAANVEIFDESGDRVIGIDSIVIEPRWLDLLQRRFSVRNITLYSPEINLVFSKDGSLNLREAFVSTRAESDSAGVSQQSDSEWAFRSATIHIIEGVLITSNSGDIPSAVSAGKIFDYSNSSFENIHVEARIDWIEPTRVIDILRFSGSVDYGRMKLESGQAQVLVDEDRLTLNEFAFKLGRSSVALQGWIEHGARQGTADWMDLPFELEILPELIDFDELKILFPALPVGDIATISGTVRGPVSNLTLTSLRVSSDDASLELNGTLAGLPSNAIFEISVVSTPLTPNQLQRWLPFLPVTQTLTMEHLEINSHIAGSLELKGEIIELTAEGTVGIRSPHGTLSTSFELDGPLDDSLHYDVRLAASGINPAFWTGKPDLPGILNGDVRLIGTGLSLEKTMATFSSRFTDFRLADLFVPELSFDGQLDSLNFRASLHAIQLGGRLDADLKGVFDNAEPAFSLDLSSHEFDLGTFLSKDDLTTSLTLQSNLSGTGFTLDTFNGNLTVTIDSSRITSRNNSSVVLPHNISVSFQTQNEIVPRLSVRGDILDMDVRNNMPFEVLVTLAKTWIQNTGEAIKRAGDKPLYALELQDQRNEDLIEALRWNTASDAVAKHGLTFPLYLHVVAHIHRSELFTSYFPDFPGISTSGRAEITVRWTPLTVVFDASYEADSIRTGSLQMSRTSILAHFNASSKPSIDESVRLSLIASSDSLVVGGQNVREPSLNISYSDRTGHLQLFSPGTGPLDSLVVDATLFLLPDRTRLHFDQIRLQAENTFWISTGTSDIEWYSDALLVNDIRLIQWNDDGPTGQSFFADGRLSELETDTLIVEAQEVILHDLSNFAHINPHFGGLLNARVAITRDQSRPTIAGLINVERMSVDSWIIGDLTIRSTLIPGSPDIGISLVLLPVDSLADAVIYGTRTPASIKQNRLDVQGIVRLPDQSAREAEKDGLLDLDVNIDRADLFFFEYIFNELNNVSGYISGDGRIGGTPEYPVFDINLGLHEGSFDIPLTNLTYGLEGNIRIDENAIHIQSASISDPTGGVASISGNLLFNNYRFFTLNLVAVLDEFQIMNVAFSDDLPFYGFLWASGDLTVDGPLFDANMRSPNAVMTPNSELFIPVVETATMADIAYIVHEDSLGRIPDFKQRASRSFLLAHRPDAERRFLDALDMDFNIFAPEGSTLHLVIDPLLGDVVNAQSSGRVQLQRTAGNFSISGSLEVSGGDYLFTAGEFFVRRFLIDPGGTITWNGDPINAELNIPASYKTRASTAGLSGVSTDSGGLIPLIVSLQITGTVDAPEVTLGLLIDRSNQTLGEYQAVEAALNAPGRASEYATSVLLTNSFMLTTDNVSSSTGSQLAFNSVSQLVSTQLNRFINEALPNVDITFGLQGENAQDLDVTYGVALRLMDEKLIIRGQGLYQGSSSSNDASSRYEGIQGEFIVEIKLSSHVSVEAFFRREGDIFNSGGLTDTSGAGVSYQTEFSSWRMFWNKMFDWISSSDTNQEYEASRTPYR